MRSCPATLAGVLAELAVVESRVHTLLGHPAGILQWKPAPGRWSILQCVQHLALTNELLAGSVEPRLALAPARHNTEDDSLRVSMLWRLLLALVEPQARLKGFAPPVLQPPPSLDTEAAAKAYTESHARLRSLVARCRGMDVNQLFFPHPVLRLRMSAAGAFLLIVAHERRHLEQAERVLSAANAVDCA